MDQDINGAARQGASLAAVNAAPRADARVEGRGDFDFESGEWRVRHRKLKRRLAGETGWWTFDGTCRAWSVMDGCGSVEDNWLDDPTGPYRASAFRRLDPETGQWAIWWFDGRVAGTVIDPPVVGRFKNGVGTFVASDVFEDRPILVRFLWTDITPRSARWEQAFSPDRGETWEVNWVMTFERTA
jgi:hypothetical protein